MSDGKNTAVVAGEDMSAANIEELLGELEVDENDDTQVGDGIQMADGDDVIEDSPDADDETSASEEEIEQINAIAESAEEAADEAAAAAEADAEKSASDDTSAAEPAKKTKTKKASKPKVERDLSALPEDLFILDSSDVPADKAANKTSVIARRPKQKKVAEKFDNMFVSMNAGREPTHYAVLLYDIIRSNGGSATSAELVNAMKATSVRGKAARTYDDGTARSQVGQIMILFDTLGIATRTGQKLDLNSGSTIGAYIEKYLPSP